MWTEKKITAERKRYVLLYKPAGYVTTTADRFAKRKVTDLVNVPERVYPVGRLDADAEGLLMLTNDGGFANRLMHPRFEVEKTYVAKLQQKLQREDVEKIRRGIFIEGRKVTAKIRLRQKDVAEVTIHKGRHKIVERLFKSVGNYVARITRTRIGQIGIGGLKRGMWRELAREEIAVLLALAGTAKESGKDSGYYLHSNGVNKLRAYN